MWCIVGLGNPGSSYRGNRHNVGFRVIDRLCRAQGIRLDHRSSSVAWGQGTWRNETLALAKPLTFMNRSGLGIRTLLRKTHAGVDELIVIHDDLDLALGRLKFKQRGGGGGHKGILSIIETLGRDDFLRLRIGIGRPVGGMDPSDYVLSDFNAKDHEVVEGALDMAAEALRTLIQEGLPKAMNCFHTKSITEDH